MLQRPRIKALIESITGASVVPAGVIAGYASVFGNVDLKGDVVEAGAFAGSVAEGNQFPVYWAHSYQYQPASFPVGITRIVREDDRGLYFKADVLPTQAGRELVTLIAAGAIRGASIGYHVPPYGARRSGETGIRHIKTASLVEISVATMGIVNPLTSVGLVEIPGRNTQPSAAATTAEAFQSNLERFLEGLKR